MPPTLPCASACPAVTGPRTPPRRPPPRRLRSRPLPPGAREVEAFDMTARRSAPGPTVTRGGAAGPRPASSDPTTTAGRRREPVGVGAPSRTRGVRPRRVLGGVGSSCARVPGRRVRGGGEAAAHGSADPRRASVRARPRVRRRAHPGAPCTTRSSPPGPRPRPPKPSGTRPPPNRRRRGPGKRRGGEGDGRPPAGRPSRGRDRGPSAVWSRDRRAPRGPWHGRTRRAPPAIVARGWTSARRCGTMRAAPDVKRTHRPSWPSPPFRRASA